MKGKRFFRRELPRRPQLVVVKVGSAAVSRVGGGLSLLKIGQIIADVAVLRQQKVQVVIVSSGAVSAGRPLLPAPGPRKTSMSYKQACAAVGQPLLMHAYHKAALAHKISLAQILLTHEDFKHKERYLNARNTLTQLLQRGVVPIINENDPVSFAEIACGDNDHLAAMIGELLDAQVVAFLTAADGIFQEDPEQTGACPIPRLVHPLVRGKITSFRKTAQGTGGIESKLMAINKLLPLGIWVLVGTFRRKSPLLTLFCSEVGTVGIPAPRFQVAPRYRWALAQMRAQCVLWVDEGAYRALLKNGSLLPVGIWKIEGSFQRGDWVQIKFGEHHFAIGQVEYNYREVTKMLGKKTSEVQAILPLAHSAVVIHRDNLFLSVSSTMGVTA